VREPRRLCQNAINDRGHHRLDGGDRGDDDARQRALAPELDASNQGSGPPVICLHNTFTRFVRRTCRRDKPLPFRDGAGLATPWRAFATKMGLRSRGAWLGPPTGAPGTEIRSGTSTRFQGTRRGGALQKLEAQDFILARAKAWGPSIGSFFP